jgi:hypothetical protein
MPPTFWAEALHTATHLINIRPTSSQFQNTLRNPTWHCTLL